MADNKSPLGVSLIDFFVVSVVFHTGFYGVFEEEKVFRVASWEVVDRSSIDQPLPEIRPLHRWCTEDLRRNAITSSLERPCIQEEPSGILG
jgi:hypothetical protein